MLVSVVKDYSVNFTVVSSNSLACCNSSLSVHLLGGWHFMAVRSLVVEIVYLMLFIFATPAALYLEAFHPHLWLYRVVLSPFANSLVFTTLLLVAL